jgi:hypothetical protein
MAWLRYTTLIVNFGCALLCLPVACGGSTTEYVTQPPPAADGSGDDAGVKPPPPPPGDDGGTIKPQGEKCTKQRPADPPAAATTPGAFFTTHPMPQIVNQGGKVLSNPKIVPIFFAGDAMADALEDFVGSFGCTDHWRKAVGEYGVGDAIASTSVRLTEKAPTSTTDTAMEAWLANKITSKAFEAPTPDTVYMIFYPDGTTIEQGGAQSCQQFGGYHTNITLPDGTDAAYGVVPRCKNFGGMGVNDSTTGSASHEIMEAATDPYNKQSPAYAYVDDQHYAWMFVLGGESGDLCAQEEDAFYKPQGYKYTVQRNWSNIAARSGKDPCLPGSGKPWFTAAPKLTDDIDLFGAPSKGVTVPAGTSKTIDLDVYSEDPAESITVDVMDGGNLGGGGGGASSTYALDRSSGKNGDTLKLTITAPAGASQSELFIVVLNGNGKMRIAWVGAVGH